MSTLHKYSFFSFIFGNRKVSFNSSGKFELLARICSLASSLVSQLSCQELHELVRSAVSKFIAKLIRKLIHKSIPLQLVN